MSSSDQEKAQRQIHVKFNSANATYMHPLCRAHPPPRRLSEPSISEWRAGGTHLLCTTPCRHACSSPARPDCAPPRPFQCRSIAWSPAPSGYPPPPGVVAPPRGPTSVSYRTVSPNPNPLSHPHNGVKIKVHTHEVSGLKAYPTTASAMLPPNPQYITFSHPSFSYFSPGRTPHSHPVGAS